MSWLSKGLKKIGKSGILRTAAGFIPGVGGLIAGAASTALTRAPQVSTPIRVDRPGVIDLPGGIGINLPWAGPPGVGILPSGTRRGRIQAGPNGQCPQGYHLNKSKSGDGLPAKSYCVRNRRVNYANGRAASRAGRRVRGTVKLLKKSFTLVSAKAPKGKWIPKGRR